MTDSTNIISLRGFLPWRRGNPHNNGEAMSKLSHNVISLPVPKSDASTDHGLIRNCVAYAKALGAFHEGSNADPDGNGAFSGGSPSFQRLKSRARKLLTTIARTPATTANGLEAKARIVPMIMRDADGDFQDREQEFFGHSAPK